MSKKNNINSQTVKNSEAGALITELFRSFPEKKYSLKALSSAIGGGGMARQYTHDAIQNLVEQRVIEELADGKYRLIRSHSNLNMMEGVVDMIASGSMYVKMEGDDKDIFVDKRMSRNALHGDKVKVAIIRGSKTGSPQGEIVEIVERSKKNYVGQIELSRNYAFVKVDSRKVPVDILIPHTPEGGLVNGQKVLVHITDWQENMKSPVGEIVDIFGFAGENNAEMHAILAEFDLPYKFEEAVEKAADAISEKITESDYAERRDFRSITTFTIDPADAKDFDDALSIRKLADNLWEVGVHIADVTHYVREGSVVDAEGESRATSVYLVDRTVPMLPEKLSNNLCSLRPDEEKLTFSAVFEMDDHAVISKQWLGRSVIKSIKRFSYEQAQTIIETGEGELKDEVLTLNMLAQKMRKERFSNGSIAFEREEAKFKLDEQGKPLGVYFKEQKESNQLIEEFMLLANRKVAEFIGKKRGAGANANRTFVYRVHDKPDSDKLARFSSFILRFGHYFKVDKPGLIASQMNQLMNTIKGKSEENVIATLAVRTMAKAFYSTENIGHYGLAFGYYTHFTSPIRRYPDMMVHRLLAHYLDGGSSLDKERYEIFCEHSSDMEVRAAEAERASTKYKMVEFMIDRLGEQFDGHISGITEWGIYVELNQTHIEGMVSMKTIGDDYYYFDDQEYAAIGRSSGRRFTLGDEVRISILRADLQHRQLDFGMVASYDPKTKQAVEINTVMHGEYRKERSRKRR